MFVFCSPFRKELSTYLPANVLPVVVPKARKKSLSGVCVSVCMSVCHGMSFFPPGV